MTEETPICEVDGCGLPSKTRKMCIKHYKRWYKYGDPHRVMVKQTPAGEPLSFIMEVIQSDTDDCVIWPYSVYKDGYGSIRYEGVSRNAHSVSLELFTGERPDGKVAAHEPLVCHNPACINPKHLRWASRKENMHDRLLDETDLRGEKHPNSKLSERDVLDIRSSKESGPSLARKYNLNSRSTINKIKSGKLWSHIK